MGATFLSALRQPSVLIRLGIIALAAGVVLHFRKPLPQVPERADSTSITVFVECATTGSAREVAIPPSLDMAQTLDFVLQVCGSQKTAETAASHQHALLVNGRPISGGTLKEAGITHGSRLRLVLAPIQVPAEFGVNRAAKSP